MILGVEDYLRSIVEKNELLAEIQAGAQRAGLDKITDTEIELEIQAYRRSKKPKE